MAFKMKKFSGFGNSPMKQEKKVTATFEEKKKKPKEKKKKIEKFPKGGQKPIGNVNDPKFNPKHIKTLPTKPGGNLKNIIKKGIIKPLGRS